MIIDDVKLKLDVEDKEIEKGKGYTPPTEEDIKWAEEHEEEIKENSK